MRCRLVAAVVVTVGCLATAGCVQATATPDTRSTVRPTTSSPAPQSATIDGTGREQSTGESPVAAAFWAEEAEVRPAAIDYNDLYGFGPEFAAASDYGPDCAPYTWMVDLVRGDLSYDELTLRSTRAVWDQARLPQHGAELCDGDGEVEAGGEPAPDGQLLAYLSMVFLDATSPDVKREVWSTWNEGTEPIEESFRFTTSAEDYRSMARQLRAERAATGVG